jgi:hypothetical protein
MFPYKGKGFKNISLNRNTEDRRVNDHANDLREQLKELSNEFQAHSVATPMHSTNIGKDITCELEKMLEKY